MSTKLSDTAETVLLFIMTSPLGTDVHGQFITGDLLTYHFGAKRMDRVLEALQELIDADFVDLVEDEDDVWKMTPYGMAYIANRKRTSSTVFSNISNSNIAHDSPDAQQSIQIESLDSELKDKIAELENAIKNKDKAKLQQTFNYIVDKSVDVAIALITGNLVS